MPTNKGKMRTRERRIEEKIEREQGKMQIKSREQGEMREKFVEGRIRPPCHNPNKI